MITVLGIIFGTAQAESNPPRKVGPLSSELLKTLVREDHSVGDDVVGRCIWPNGTSIDYAFGFTSKGNGRLEIGGQLIRIYDYHDDGCRYEDGFLTIDLIANHGAPLLVLTGMARWSDEKGSRVIRREPVSLIFALNRQKQLELIFANPGAEMCVAWEHKSERSWEDWIGFIRREDARKHSVDRR